MQPLGYSYRTEASRNICQCKYNAFMLIILEVGRLNLRYGSPIVHNGG